MKESVEAVTGAEGPWGGHGWTPLLCGFNIIYPNYVHALILFTIYYPAAFFLSVSSFSAPSSSLPPARRGIQRDRSGIAEGDRPNCSTPSLAAGPRRGSRPRPRPTPAHNTLTTIGNITPRHPSARRARREGSSRCEVLPVYRLPSLICPPALGGQRQIASHKILLRVSTSNPHRAGPHCIASHRTHSPHPVDGQNGSSLTLHRAPCTAQHITGKSLAHEVPGQKREVFNSLARNKSVRRARLSHQPAGGATSTSEGARSFIQRKWGQCAFY